MKFKEFKTGEKMLIILRTFTATIEVILFSPFLAFNFAKNEIENTFYPLCLNCIKGNKKK